MVTRLSTLREELDARQPALQVDGSLIAYPFDWQEPAATERAAWESMRDAGRDASFEYVALPWATLIDGLNRGAVKVRPLLAVLAEIHRSHPRKAERRVTVAQHIEAMLYPELLTAVGITDVFWSHAVLGQEQVDGMRIHPFPLYPAQAPSLQPATAETDDRRWLANFIGAYRAGLYLSNVRDLIYADAGRWDDVLIVRRESWHFDRIVYEEQVRGLKPSEALVAKERAMAEEYLDAIRQSWFTLCPTGSGPNSIRVFECLALGSIPIVLTRTLRLAGDAGLWRRAAIIEDDSEAGYRRAMERARATTVAQRQPMIQAGRELALQVLPSGYGELIAGAFRQQAPADARHAHAPPLRQALSGKRICFIGFSFTGFGDQTSIGACVRQRLGAGAEDWSVREVSYGGLSINALAGLIGQASADVAAGDLVVLEIATSLVSQYGYQAADALPYVRWIVWHLIREKNARLMFMHIFRADLDDDDCVVQAVREIADEFSVPILDFKQEFRAKYPDVSVITTDGIHPTEAVRREIANLFVDFLECQPCPVHRAGEVAPVPQFGFVDARLHARGMEEFAYAGRGKRIDACVLPEGDTLEFDLGHPSRIVGLYFIYSPETGAVEVRIDGGDPLLLITRDQHSYYRRIGFRPIDKMGRLVRVTSAGGHKSIPLLRPSVLKHESRRDLICGLCVAIA
jgi:hypothetical protein